MIFSEKTEIINFWGYQVFIPNFFRVFGFGLVTGYQPKPIPTAPKKYGYTNPNPYPLHPKNMGTPTQTHTRSNRFFWVSYPNQPEKPDFFGFNFQVLTENIIFMLFKILKNFHVMLFE